MARREVIEVVCDRCKRTETQKPGSVAARDKMSNEFELNFHGTKIQYEDLCTRCRSTLKNYADKIAKVKEEKEDSEPTKPEPVSSPPRGLFNRSKATG